MPLLLLLAATAAAACPAPYPDWPTDVVDRALGVAGGSVALVGGEPVAELLGARLSLPAPDNTRELDRGWPDRSGPRAGDLPPAFGDVAVRDERWLVYLYPGVALGFDDQGGAASFERVAADQRYWRLCPELTQAFEAADVGGSVSGQLRDAAERALPVEAEEVEPLPTPVAEPEHPRRPTRVGIALGYDAAAGADAGVLFGGGWGGAGWIERELTDALQVRVDLRGTRVTSLPTEWAGVAGSLDSSSYRVAGQLRTALPVGPVRLGLGGGPAVGVFRGRLTLAEAEHLATELVAGARAGADLQVTLGRSGTALTLGAGGEAYVHRSAPASPFLLIGGALGIQFGGGRTEGADVVVE